MYTAIGSTYGNHGRELDDVEIAIAFSAN